MDTPSKEAILQHQHHQQIPEILKEAIMGSEAILKIDALWGRPTPILGTLSRTFGGCM